MIQLSYPYKTTRKTIAFTIWTKVSNVISLLFNTLSRFGMVSLPRSKCLNFMTTVTFTVILEPKKMVCHCFHFPIYLPRSSGSRCHDLSFWMLNFNPAFSLSSFTFIKRLFSSSLLSSIRVVSSANLRLLIFLPAILITVWASFSLVFCMMYFAYKLYKQGNIYSFDVLLSQLGTTPLFHVHSNCCFLTCVEVSQEASKVVWYFHLFKNFPQFVVIHTVKDFNLVSEAEVDIFLEFPFLSYDPDDVVHLISGSSALSKSSLYIWRFSVHMMLKPSLKDLSITFLKWITLLKWVKFCSSLNILWHCPSLGLEWKLTFSSSVTTAEFSKFAGLLNAAR